MRSPLLLHHLLTALLASSPFQPTPSAAFSSTTQSRQSHRTLSLGSTIMPKSPPSRLYAWRPGTELLRLDPSALCREGSDAAPRLAKDEDYASAVANAWRDEVDARPSGIGGGSVSSPFVYECESDGSPLHGHVYRSSPPPADDPSAAGEARQLPGIILFHTGAGPQDVFLRWKADSLVNERDAFGDGGCVVLIADTLGDASGWAWRDRERYAAVRESTLAPDGDGRRGKLMGRVRAAMGAMAAQPGVDPDRIGAMGFCLGGHAILELSRMEDPSVKSMATFHGVFDGVRKLSTAVGGSSSSSAGDNAVAKCSVLVCTGEDDPFVPAEDLDAARSMFQDLGYRVDMLKFEGTRHGFTNPAQDFNPSDAFAYSEEACSKAWTAALSLLKTV